MCHMKHLWYINSAFVYFLNLRCCSCMEKTSTFFNIFPCVAQNTQHLKVILVIWNDKGDQKMNWIFVEVNYPFKRECLRHIITTQSEQDLLFCHREKISLTMRFVSVIQMIFLFYITLITHKQFISLQKTMLNLLTCYHTLSDTHRHSY